ncbi:ornithine cyclodeaminase family protein [Falsigemmobacter faecalis]|uniref:Ornithine cyclodeaminase family protein n=1 Tax=Falsigemmobacter faecalis TaxID=2488730 RepID=A0A3P3DDF0_9RHOB|nr:ornithine cyclodeaminase family protein [Falsigemmobacter faecalis]RRH71482.1 ornithine cyclodeaminase family protein [Falsigemmobacter faecalis]
MTPLLYLSSAAIAALRPDPQLARDAVAQAFRLKAEGRTRMAPKTAVALQGSDVAMAMVGMLEAPGLAGVKWVGVCPGNPAAGLAAINGVIVLSDAATGLPRAILDAGWITATRTAACTGVAAVHLADPQSESAGFIGCGLQAHANLDALLLALPGLQRVRIFGRGAASRDAFAARVHELGLRAEMAPTPEAAVREMDVVVSSVPPAPQLQPFLDPRWLTKRAFVSAVDLGRSWHQAPWRAAFDLVVTDDTDQSKALIEQGKLLDGGPFDGEIGDLLTARLSPPDGRRALLFAGTPLCDLALAARIEALAREAGLGMELPR